MSSRPQWSGIVFLLIHRSPAPLLYFRLAAKMEPWGFEPQIQPCHGRVIPFHYGPGIVLNFIRRRGYVKPHGRSRSVLRLTDNSRLSCSIRLRSYPHTRLCARQKKPGTIARLRQDSARSDSIPGSNRPALPKPMASRPLGIRSDGNLLVLAVR